MASQKSIAGSAKSAVAQAQNEGLRSDQGLIGLLAVPGAEMVVHVYASDYTSESGKMSFKGRVVTDLQFNGASVSRIRGNLKFFVSSGNYQMDFSNSQNKDYENSSWDPRLSAIVNEVTISKICDTLRDLPKVKDKFPSWHKVIKTDANGKWQFSELSERAKKNERLLNEEENSFLAGLDMDKVHAAQTIAQENLSDAAKALGN